MSYVTELNRARQLAGMQPLSEEQTMKISEIMALQEDVKVGQKVENIQPMRAGKAYASFGSPAKMGDVGKVTKVNKLKDVTIVQFKKDNGDEVYTHVQNLR